LNPFRPIPPDQLNDLSDEELIAYASQARAAGDPQERTVAIQILVYGYRRDIVRRVRLRMKTYAVDEVADAALVRAVKSTFDGQSVGQFRSWLWTIVDREVADWYRTAERRPVETPLPNEHEGEEGFWGEQPSAEEDWIARLFAAECVDETLDGLKEEHRAIVESYLLDDADARRTAEETGESEANVYQVAKRFKEALRKCVEAGGNTSPDPNG
jgi:RNA polymerase sigma factor (sigma-70 family)